MAGAALTLISLILRFCITTYVVKKQKASGDDVQYFISFLIQSVTVVVVLIPEGYILFNIYFKKENYFKINIGLPLAVTLALTYAVRVSNKKFIVLCN